MLARTMSREEFQALIQGKIRVYDAFEKTVYGYHKVGLNGKYGLLDHEYRQILQPVYLSVEVVKRNVIVASRDVGVYEIFSDWGNLITNRKFVRKDEARQYASYF